MSDAIVFIFVFLLLALAVKGSIRHFRGDSPCCKCRSGDSGTRKRLEGPVSGEILARISGMRCDGCARRIEKEIERIGGAVCRADWRSSVARVYYDRPLDEKKVVSAVEKAGYVVISIEHGDSRR